MQAQQFLNYKNWVVVGDVLNESKYAYKVLNSLKASGFNVVGINPSSEDEGVYSSISMVPYKIDVVDLCINPKKGIEVVQEILDSNIDKILIQPGAESSEILDFCNENNISAIKGCALVELSRR